MGFESFRFDFENLMCLGTRKRFGVRMNFETQLGF